MCSEMGIRDSLKAGLETLTKALAMNPKSTNGHYNLGLLHLRNQDFTKAIEHLRVANELTPNIPQIQRSLVAAQH